MVQGDPQAEAVSFEPHLFQLAVRGHGIGQHRTASGKLISAFELPSLFVGATFKFGNQGEEARLSYAAFKSIALVPIPERVTDHGDVG